MSENIGQSRMRPAKQREEVEIAATEGVRETRERIRAEREEYRVRLARMKYEYRTEVQRINEELAQTEARLEGEIEELRREIDDHRTNAALEKAKLSETCQMARQFFRQELVKAEATWEVELAAARGYLTPRKVRGEESIEDQATTSPEGRIRRGSGRPRKLPSS